MYIPKKLKWESLDSFKKHLEKDTKERVVKFNGYQLITETTKYGLCLGELSYTPLNTENSKKSKINNDEKNINNG